MHMAKVVAHPWDVCRQIRLVQLKVQVHVVDQGRPLSLALAPGGSSLPPCTSQAVQTYVRKPILAAGAVWTWSLSFATMLQL